MFYFFHSKNSIIKLTNIRSVYICTIILRKVPFKKRKKFNIWVEKWLRDPELHLQDFYHNNSFWLDKKLSGGALSNGYC